MMTNQYASRYPTCSGSSAFQPTRIHLRKGSSRPITNCHLRAPTSGLASLLCRASDSLGEFRSDECAAPVKLLEDEVQHVFLGKLLGSGRICHQKDTRSWSATITSPMLGYFMVGPLLLRQKSRGLTLAEATAPSIRRQ